MKFNVSTEINWVVDGKIDDVLKERVLKELAKKITAEVASEDLEKWVSERLAAGVDDYLTQTLEKFLRREIRITDAWGDIQAEYEGLEELLKKKFDDFMSEPVNPRDGSSVGSCRMGNPSRLEWMVQGHVEKYGNKMRKQFSADVQKMLDGENQKIRQEVENQVKEGVAKIFSENLLLAGK